ncbi:hypothetical protein BP5796_10991 [Coleophoma crateriformis]|uniref:JmjC domain-containing protein n=1 Tax=Coleophoma crateriformis TaxID=565419 RepID=A0A3D8QLM3_9HELO|nr:hypothetical protein BP5796_10991 [Coleophoma crateriformis]
MGQLTRQFNEDNFRDPRRQRLYLKDIDCPKEWHDQLESILPESLFYLNDCIESRTGGAGAILEPNQFGQMVFGKGVAPAGDLMSSLPDEMRALNMQCYVGHEGTYTPAHREMCASLGHNIMVETSTDHRGEKAGSSIWFMTETKEREVVSEYFLSMLGHDIEVEKHFAQINAWKKAPFNVWVVEQKVGDLILIPPLAPHQVWNRGTRTMKAAWNRTTIDTLELAIREALPRARMVCRDEQYKNKAIIYYTLKKYHALLQRDAVEQKMWKFGRIKQVLDDFRRLFALFSEILISESFSPTLPQKDEVEFLPYDSNVTCSYCRCNIFNRFLTCKSCIEYGEAGAEDTYDVCMECYVMGRSCACISNLHWVEQWHWSELVESYEDWRNMVIKADEQYDEKEFPLSFDEARQRYERKPVAEIVQEQLKNRPWHDIRKVLDLTPEPSDAETDPELEARPKKKRGKRNKRSKAKMKTHTCHVCMHQEWNWKLAFCSTCPKAYCYGVLFRAFDQMPQAVMENVNWQCPECLGICSCGKCRRGKKQKPYAPKGTLLGHDTRAVADFRSVESLVDFSRTNLAWLRQKGDENPQESSRMKRLREKAEAEKEREREENERREDSDEGFIEGGASGQEMPAAELNFHESIDPSLLPNENHSTPQVHSSRQIAGESDGEVGDLSLRPRHLRDCVRNEEYQSPYSAANYEGQEELGQSPQGPAPMAPMFTSATAYPDPTHFDQTRMMGIGYYQQGDGIDKILYDAPNSGTPPQEPTAFDQNLLDPNLMKTVSDATSKRKRQDLDDAGSNEENIRNQKRRDNVNTDFNSSISKGRSTRKRTVEIQSFSDIDAEEIIQGDVDAQIFNNRLVTEPQTAEGDFELEKQATIQIEKIAVTEKPSPKKKDEPPLRRSLRGQHSMSPRLSLPTENPSRQSAWLGHKETAEQGLLSAVKVPNKRGRPRSTPVKTKHAPETARVSSRSKSADDNSKQNVENKDQDGESSGSGRATRGRGDCLNWPQSRADPIGRIVQTEDSDKSMEDSIMVEIPVLPESSPAATEKRLSLREKMALQGKSIKIVGPKSQRRLGAADSSRAILGVHVSDRPPKLSSQVPPLDRGFRASSTRLELAAKKKGPTVVRLADSESGEDSMSSILDESSSDESIPATQYSRTRVSTKGKDRG